MQTLIKIDNIIVVIICWQETIGIDHDDCRRKQNGDENQKIWVIYCWLTSE